MNYILVGDPHITINNIEDGRRLFDHIIDVLAKDNENLVILGDLFNSHSTVRLEVQNFWTRNFQILSRIFNKVFVIVGNHDMIIGEGKYAGLHSLDVYKNIYKNIHIIDTPMAYDNILFMPYYHDNELFTKVANQIDTDYIMCHQSFIGAKLPSGITLTEGVDLTKIKQKVISGHIHMRSVVGQCIYTGTPMWLTADDAGQEKYIDVFNSSTGMFTSIPTRQIVTPINKTVILDEIDPKSIQLDKGKNIIEVVGTEEYIKKVKAHFGSTAIIKARVVNENTENKEIIYDFETFLDMHYKSDKAKIIKMIEGLE